MSPAAHRRIVGVAGWVAFGVSLAGAYGVVWLLADALPEWLAWSSVAETFVWPVVLLVAFGALMAPLAMLIRRAAELGRPRNRPD